ncbi:WhiB family transcriptional regulator [Actinomycetospora termitidis]|uniref:WhiB family transcriptional regulator n=1 Tax=Actinomycetospora termitidis TaxID=3053470 RepID=A0ABT7MFK4_9PSEU|nr:WhiB family transcriptional regulator [Actinomycetospora sp. Odt1-22]MDL5159458.1 WhiB family transcriptional regulator [Actinomycetospora sp. Odt1-22]
MHAVMEQEEAVDGQWWLAAACRGADLRRFFPERPGLTAAATIRQFCQGCPVMVQCRGDAKAGVRRPFGVWGGEYHAGTGNQTWTLADLEAQYGGRVESATPGASGHCGWCDVTRRLRSDGMLRLHWVPAGGGTRVQCPGSGYAPKGGAS